MKKITRFLVPLMLGILILASIVWYLFIYDRDFTRDTLLSQARFHDEHGNSRISSMFYDMAYDFSGHDENVAIELANQYKADGNYTKAEYTLTMAINSVPTVELYIALCKTYVEQDKLLDAVNLMDNISHPEIKKALDARRPDVPIADYEPGYYSKYIDIRLYSSDNTKIYYTTDGDYPSIAGSVFEEGIPLPAGETTIYAIAVDDEGLVSPVTVVSYTITGVIEEVTFTDPVLEAAMREKIGADAEDVIYTNQLWDITEFTVPEGVKDLSDLKLLPNLTTLTVQRQELTTLEPISGLFNLESLDLSGCRFPAEDLAYIATLPNLTHLTMEECGLSTIASLANAPALTHLNLNSNTLRNLDVLAPMNTLVEIKLNYNAVGDLSALGGLTNLEHLELSFNAITSLAPLSGCIRLKHLNVDNNQLYVVNGVESLPMLEELSLDYNFLTDISLLGKCTTLKNLSIASNSITDISALSTLTGLEIFDFSANQIAALPAWPEGCMLHTIDGSYNALANIDVLASMEHLAYVYMDYNLLTNIDPLADCFCLVQVNVFGNPIPDVSKLRERDIIVNYDPTVQ